MLRMAFLILSTEKNIEISECSEIVHTNFRDGATKLIRVNIPRTKVPVSKDLNKSALYPKLQPLISENAKHLVQFKLFIN